MKAATFIREKALIEKGRGRTASWRKKALAALMREAGAQLAVVDGQVIGHRLASGQIVCTRVRFKTWEAAQDQLEQIALTDGTHVKPNWWHPCPHCRGWHLAVRKDKPQL